MKNFADKLYGLAKEARDHLFLQGEMAELTSISYNLMIEQIKNHNENEPVSISYPIGYLPNDQTISTTRDYSKEELIKLYQYLGSIKLPKDGIFQLVTIVEKLLTNIFKDVLLEFPVKISGKRKIDAEKILEANTLDEIKVALIDSILNELSYKSPKDFAESFKNYVGVDLISFPAFHSYIELKATRDIHIHDSGIANEIYISKADTLARVKKNQHLPVTAIYFLRSYECCIQLTEILERELNKIWPSRLFKEYKEKLDSEDEKSKALDNLISEKEENNSSDQ